MKIWDGLRADTADTEGDCMMVKNVNYRIIGELQRRNGMSQFAAQSGRSIHGFRNSAGQSFAVFVTSAGAVVSVDV